MLTAKIEAMITILRIEMEVNEEAIQGYKQGLKENSGDHMKSFYKTMIAASEAKQEAKIQHMSNLKEILETL